MAGENTIKNAELLRKYLTTYQAWGADAGKIADFREAQAYYSQAIDAITDFNRSDDDTVKNAILYTGTFIAMKAVNGFEHVIAKYRDDFRNDPQNKGVEFKIPCTTEKVSQDKLEEYANLARNIRELTPEMDLWLKKFTNGQHHSQGEEYDGKFWAIPIQERGLKIYHLKSLIDYCEAMMKGINILASDSLSETFNAENVNYYFEKGSGRLTSLSIAFAESCRIGLNNCKVEDICTMAVRCRNLFTDFMSAIILSEYPNLVLDNMDITDLFVELTKCTKKPKSVQMLLSFEDQLLELITIANYRDPEDFPPMSKMESWLSQALEIGNAMKMDISDYICRAIDN